MGIGFIVFMGVFVWLFSYNTPKQNPKKMRAAGGGGGGGGGHRGGGGQSRQRHQGRSQPDKVNVFVFFSCQIGNKYINLSC